MNSDDHPVHETAQTRPAGAVFSAPEMARLWHDLPFKARRQFAVSAGRQWHVLWLAGFELDGVPPCVWGWRVDSLANPLTLPENISSSAQKPISRGRMIRALAGWLFSPGVPFSEVERLRAIASFARSAAMPRATRARFARAVLRAARSEAASNARELYLEILDETNRLCRQSVGCRCVWLPDTRRTADEFRREVEAALRSSDAAQIKHSDVALVTRTWLNGEEVVIKRHRFAKPGKRLKYLWRMSRARRAWAAGLALQRLGLPVPEPLGFLEIMRKGRVTDSYIINRWLPGCRTPREIIRIEPPGTPRGERRRGIALWRAAWLDLIARGVYHADTKLTNALVQTTANRSTIHWIDLECVQIGARFTPYRILRNIVQMNGSLIPRITLRDRLWFLKKLPAHLRWLKNHRCIRLLSWWTDRRLDKEKRGVAGP